MDVIISKTYMEQKLADKLFMTEYFGEVKETLKGNTPPPGVNRTAGMGLGGMERGLAVGPGASAGHRQ